MEIETAKMSPRGQIIIPKEIRKDIKAKENTIFTIMSFDGDTIIMKKLDKNKLWKDFLQIRKTVKKMTPQEINEEIRLARKTKDSS